VTLSNRYIELGGVVISRTRIEVPDNERGTVNGYPGFTVQDRDTGIYRGDYYRDATHWCWRAIDGIHYGREVAQRDAIAKLLEVGRQ